MSTIAVVGASGRTGRLVCQHLLRAGHEVVAVSRSAPDLVGVRHVPTDVLEPGGAEAALRGVDAVVVTLGIADNPVLVRLRGARGTHGDIRSRGTRRVVEAMRTHGIERMVALSSYGVGDSAAGLSTGMRVVFALLLRPQMDDHEVQEQVVRTSGTRWTLVRPVNLVDEGERGPLVADASMRTASMKVDRDQVAAYLAAAVTDDDLVGRTVALSS